MDTFADALTVPITDSLAPPHVEARIEIDEPNAI
jgi:hypothetical protein